MATCRSRCEAACMASAGARGGPGRGRALSRSLVGSGPLQRLPYVGCMWEREPKGGRHQPKTVAGTSGDPCTFRRLSVAVAARGRDRTLEVGGSTPLGSTRDSALLALHQLSHGPDLRRFLARVSPRLTKASSRRSSSAIRFRRSATSSSVGTFRTLASLPTRCSSPASRFCRSLTPAPEAKFKRLLTVSTRPPA